MKLIEKKDNALVFTLNTNETLANALRRTIQQIPTMAIDEVEISRNDSPLYDETLAHRLGLVPMKMEKSFKKDDVKKLKLNSKKEGSIYSGEIKGDVEVVYDKIPLTLLDKEQALDIAIKTKVGNGEEHSKFTPGLIYYRIVSEVTMDGSLKEDFKKAFPNKEIKEKGNSFTVKDDSVKTIVDFCEGLAKKAGKDVSTKDGEEIMFIIESFGQIDTDEIFKKILDVLRKELKDVSKVLK